jgi:hypothetical protein
MFWTLILFAHVGMMSDKDSMALTSVPGFRTQQECVAAGKTAEKMASGTTKVMKFTCVEVTKSIS